jgi:hypothetical protein
VIRPTFSRVRSRAGIGLTTGIVVVGLLATALAAPASPNQTFAQAGGCGKIESTSIYAKAKVIALRGVGCRKARHVAKRFDHSGDLTIGRWRCAYAHNDLPNLFSCGWPADGNLRQADHALLARGVPGT